ncbi:MAG: TIGR03943 family protein [Actinomycetota bacterium]
MNRIGRAAVMLALGGITARLLLNGGFGWFVQQRMKLPLWGATVVLLVFGAYELWMGSRDERHDPESTRWPVGPRVGWLMVLPLVVLISVAPTGLGAAAAGRVDAYTPDDTTDAFEPLDTSDGPVEMRVFDFLDRALWDEQGSLEGVPIRLEGLVVNDESVDDGFRLTRFLVSCCAADGIPLQVTLHGTGPALDDDEWVVVDVTWRPPDVPYQEAEGDWVVEADVISLTVEDSPKDPYESPY